MAIKEIPTRGEIDKKFCWDLSSLFKNEKEWDECYENIKKSIPKMESYKGRLVESIETLKEFLDYSIMDVDLQLERLGYYAMLRKEENLGDSKSIDRYSRLIELSSAYGAASSFVAPELQATPQDQIDKIMANENLSEYHIYLDKLFRYKPHTLSSKEEALLAKQAIFSSTANRAFSALNNVDLQFGEIKTSKGEMELSHGTFGLIMQDRDPDVRYNCFNQYYKQFDNHKSVLAELYNGSVQKDIFGARVRNYNSCREKALFPDKVDESVYDNLISVVHDNLHLLHKYYEIRRKKLGLDKLRHCDVYVPIVEDVETDWPYEEGVKEIVKALKPLGDEYCKTISEGLLGTWVDRYETKGKRSGAFSAGSFKGEPYILMNYKKENLNDLFTLAHEGGHSMHSWYSVKSNPYPHYNYTIFEAEVASTFNEQLLATHLMKNAGSDKMKSYLLGKQIDDIIGTLFRQTMFAEFEYKIHKLAEEGVSVTIDLLRAEYRKLLKAYFGPDVELFEESDLEGLRIPHFYRAFYVYKYATGLSASVALAQRVLNGSEKERDEYLTFLKSGGSRYPIESLKIAGVDMSKPEPIKSAMAHFESLLESFSRS